MANLYNQSISSSSRESSTFSSKESASNTYSYKPEKTSTLRNISNAIRGNGYSQILPEKYTEKNNNKTQKSNFMSTLVKAKFIFKKTKDTDSSIKNNFETQYLNEIDKDNLRYEDEGRIKHMQRKTWLGQLVSSQSQAEKREHSRIYNFFMYKSQGRKYQRKAASLAVSANTHIPYNKETKVGEFEHQGTWQKFGLKIIRCMTGDTTRNKDLLSENPRMVRGFFKGGLFAQYDNFPTHFGTAHITSIVASLGALSGLPLGLLSVATSMSGVAIEGLAMMGVNVVQDGYIDGMPDKLDGSSINLRELEKKGKDLSKKLELVSNGISDATNEIIELEEKLNISNEREKIANKITQKKANLIKNFGRQFFEVMNANADKIIDPNKKEYENILSINPNNNTYNKLLNFISKKDIDDILNGNPKTEKNIIDAINQITLKKMLDYGQSLADLNDILLNQHRRHNDNGKEVFSTHFYQNQIRIAAAIGVGASFFTGMPILAIPIIVAKCSAQFGTSGLDEVIRYIRKRIPATVIDGGHHFFHKEALELGLAEYYRNSNPILFEEKMADIIFANETIASYEAELDKINIDIKKKERQDPSIKDSLIDLQKKKNTLEELINLRKINAKIYKNNKNAFDNQLNDKDNKLGHEIYIQYNALKHELRSTYASINYMQRSKIESKLEEIRQNKNIIWNAEDFETYELLQNKIKDVNLPIADIIKLKNQIVLLEEKAVNNNLKLFEKVSKAKQNLDDLRKTRAEKYLQEKKDELIKQRSLMKFSERRLNYLSYIRKHQHLFHAIMFSKDNVDIKTMYEKSCAEIYGNKWRKYSKEEKEACIIKFRIKLNFLRDISDEYLQEENDADRATRRSSTEDVYNKRKRLIESVIAKNETVISHNLKSYKSQVNFLDSEVIEREKAIKSIYLKYSQASISVTTPNLRRAQNAIAECAIRKDKAKDFIKSQVKVREGIIDPILNYELSGALRDVTNANYNLSKYLIDKGIMPKNQSNNELDYDELDSRLIGDKKYLHLREKQKQSKANFDLLSNDVANIKKSIMFRNRIENPAKKGEFITKDANGKYVPIREEWKYAVKNVSNKNTNLVELFYKDIPLIYHGGKAALFKPGIWAAQMGYRFHSSALRFAAPIAAVFGSIDNMIHHTKSYADGYEPSYITNGKTDLDDAKFINVHDHVDMGRLASQALGPIAILDFILLGIWQLRYNKQYFANTPEAQRKIAQLEALLQNIYTNVLNKKDKIDFSKIKNNDKTELDKIKLITNKLGSELEKSDKNKAKANSGLDSNEVKNYSRILLQALDIHNTSKIVPTVYLNSIGKVNNKLPYLKMPETISINEKIKGSNGEIHDVCFFKANTTNTNHYAASQSEMTGKFARPRVAIKSFPKRLKGISITSSIGFIKQPIDLLRQSVTNYHSKNKIENKESIVEMRSSLGSLSKIVGNESSLNIKHSFKQRII